MNLLEKREVKKTLENVTRLANSQNLSVQEIDYINSQVSEYIIRYGYNHRLRNLSNVFTKTLENSVSDILKLAPEKIDRYFEHLRVLCLYNVGSVFNPENHPEYMISSSFSRKGYLRSTKELIIKAPNLAEIVHSSINDPPLESLYLPEDRSEEREIIEHRNAIYYALKDLHFSKKKLQILESSATQFFEHKKVLSEAFWIGTSTVIKHQPKLFPKYIEFGLRIEKENTSGNWLSDETQTYLRFTPKLLIETPERFSSFQRWSEPIIQFVRDKSTFFRYAPELMIKDPKLFIEYVKYGLKASNISGVAYTPELEQSMFWKPYDTTEIDYFEIGAKLMHIGLEAFRLYVGQLAGMTDNFTDNSKARGYLKELVSPTISEGDSCVKYGQSLIQVLKNNLQNNRYRGILLHSEDISTNQRKFWNSTDIADKRVSALLQYIDADLKGEKNHISLINSFSDSFVEEISKITGYKEVLRNGRLNGNITELEYSEKLMDLLTDFFNKRKVSSEFIRELKDIKKIAESINIMVDKICVNTNQTPLEDFVNESKHPYYYFDPKSSFDCLAFDGKYAGHSAKLLSNTKSVFINVDAYLGNRKVDTLTRAIATESMFNNKKTLYIAGVSSRDINAHFPQWKKLLYLSIIELAQRNQENIDGVLFDLNPRNRSRFSHEWAEYVAGETGLKEGKDYIYEKRSLATEKFPTHRKEIVFELINPEWKEIRILRDEGLEGKFFLEGVMQEPKNKEIGPGIEPDLVYDKGYVIGKYVSIK